jgi:hypothetical protein
LISLLAELKDRGSFSDRTRSGSTFAIFSAA